MRLKLRTDLQTDKRGICSLGGLGIACIILGSWSLLVGDWIPSVFAFPTGIFFCFLITKCFTLEIGSSKK